MKTYEHILKVVRETPWAIHPDVLQTIKQILAMRAAGEQLTEEEIAERIGAASARPASARVGTIAVLPVYGVILPKASMMTEMSGGTSIARFRQAFREAMASREVGSILLDIDSPGGMAEQLPEMASEIRASRGSKPIVAIANTLAASAAYWLGSQADSFFATPSAQVGSIGVFSVHQDLSAAAEQAGVKTTLISAGKFKTEGNPFEPLSEEARAHVQEIVDGVYGTFVSDVAKGRNVSVDTVRSGFGQGRVERAPKADELGMVDGVATFDQVVMRMMRSQVSSSRAAALGAFEQTSATASAPITNVVLNPATDPAAVGLEVADPDREPEGADEPEVDEENERLNREPSRADAMQVIKVADSGVGKGVFTVEATIPGRTLAGLDPSHGILYFEGEPVASVANGSLDVHDQPDGLRLWARLQPNPVLRSLLHVRAFDTLRTEHDAPDQGAGPAKLRAVMFEMAGAKGRTGRSPDGQGRTEAPQQDAPSEDEHELRVAALKARAAERTSLVKTLEKRVSRL